MDTYHGLAELEAAVGQEIGPTDWFLIDQARVDGFADDTEDHQWIHVDPERARETPFGGTIAHGYYTLSLAARFLEELLHVEGVSIMVNYGLNRLRFPAVMPVGGRVRMHLRLASVDDIPGGAMLTFEMTFEREGGEKPVCVAEALTCAYGN